MSRQGISITGPTESESGATIESVNAIDNTDGTTSLSFAMTDGNTFGPYTTTLVGDSIDGITRVRLADGLVSAPSYGFTNSTNTGMYMGGTGVNVRIRFTAAGQDQLFINNSGVEISEDIKPTSDNNSWLGNPVIRWAQSHTMNEYVYGTLNLATTTASQLLLTDGSKNVVSSLTLPSGCAATNMSLTTPTVTTMQAGAGLVGTPSYGFTSTAGTGIYSTANNELAFASGSGKRMWVLNGTLNCALNILPDSTAGLRTVGDASKLFAGVYSTFVQTLGTQSTIRIDSNVAFSAPVAVMNGTTSTSATVGVDIVLSTGSKLSYVRANGLGNVMVAPGGATTDKAFCPASTGDVYLGNASYKWAEIFCANATINTSDANEKNTIETSPLGLSFIQALTPRRFKFNEGSSGRFHYGLIAQEVKSVMDSITVSANDFAGFIEDTKRVETPSEIEGEPTVTFEPTFGLRYTEFIAPMIKAIQELSATVAAQQLQIDALSS